MPAGQALVDTGAQHGIIGLPSYEALVAKLAEYGLKPKQIPTLNVAAAGIGGQTKFLLSAEVPTAIAGCSGIITVHVIEQDVPMLLPIGLCKALGMNLRLAENSIAWEGLGGKVSPLSEVEGGEHIAIDILDFGERMGEPTLPTPIYPGHHPL